MEQPPASATDFLGRVRRAKINPGSIALWYIGGAGYIVRTETTTLLIDPFLGPSNPPDWIRTIPPAFDSEQLKDLGALAAVLLTHEHGDHADPVALGPLGQKTDAIAIGSESCLAVAREVNYPEDRLHLLTHDQSRTIGDITVTAVDMLDPGAQGCNGYVLESAGVTILHCGDSLYFPGFLALGQRWSFDAICVSVAANPPGRTFYMDEADAARAARDTKTRILIPHHYDLWQGFTLDPDRVRRAMHWYDSSIRVTPARFGRRITISH